MNILTIVMLFLLVIAFASIWTLRKSRVFFDVIVFIILLFLLLGQLGAA